MSDTLATIDLEKPLVTIDMLKAGAEAYQRWDPENEEIEALVASVYFSMLDALKPENSSFD